MPGPSASLPRRLSHRTRPLRWRAIALATACLAAAAGCSSASARPVTAGVSLPHTPVGSQAGWLLGVVAHPPIPTHEVTAHFDSTFLAQVSPAQLNATLARVASLRLDSVTSSSPGSIVFVVTANGTARLDVSMAVDSRGLIRGLLLRPAGASSAPSPPPAPSSWSGVDHDIRSVAPQVRFLVAAVHGTGCQPINAIDAGVPGPLGSAFKLYVLEALARAVAAGQVSWNQQLTVTSQIKSLPSGVLQNAPDGTRVSVRQVANGMISISDNTAANMLINLLGRGAVESATRAAGMADPRLDVPFLTTRELFVLKLDDWPELAGRYLRAGAAGRQALLTRTVDRVPLSTLSASPWTTPRDVNSLEWFASPTDICHLYATLAAQARQPKLAPAGHALSINSGGLSLRHGQWRTVWFKGGSEPGVLTLNYLATTRSGQSYVVSVLAANPAAPIPASATPKLLSAVSGALTLAAR